MYTKNVIYYIIIVTLSLSPRINAQNKLFLNLKISLDNDSIGVLDPVAFKILIKNISADKYIKIYPIKNGRQSTSYGEFQIEYRKDNGPWCKYIINTRAYERLSDTAPFVSIAPGQEVVSDQYAWDLQTIFDKNITTPSVYQIKASYHWLGQLNPDEWLVSEPVTLFVQPYNGEDLVAYKYLLGLPTPNFIYEPLYYGSPVLSNDGTFPFISNAKFIISSFPKSKFATWAKVYISTAYNLLALNENKNFEDNLNYLRESKSISFDILTKNDHLSTVITYETLSAHLPILENIQYKYKSDISKLFKEFSYDEK